MFCLFFYFLFSFRHLSVVLFSSFVYVSFYFPFCLFRFLPHSRLSFYLYRSVVSSVSSLCSFVFFFDSVRFFVSLCVPLFTSPFFSTFLSAFLSTFRTSLFPTFFSIVFSVVFFSHSLPICFHAYSLPLCVPPYLPFFCLFFCFLFRLFLCRIFFSVFLFLSPIVSLSP